MTDSLPTIGWMAAIFVVATFLVAAWCILRSRQRTRTYEAATARFEEISKSNPDPCSRPTHGVSGLITSDLERRQRYAKRALAFAPDPDVTKGAKGGGAAQTGRRTPSPVPGTQGGGQTRRSV